MAKSIMGIKQGILVSILVLFCSCASVPQDRGLGLKDNEWIEWCNIWHVAASENDLPRILFIGDSITNQYFESVSKRLKGKAYCSYLCTSSSAGNPALLEQIKLVLNQYDYSVIHFNNGLHGGNYSDQWYRDGLEDAINLLKTEKNAVLVWARITPYNPQSKTYEGDSARVDRRNAIADAIATRYGLPANDLHTPMKGHAEYFKDDLHYKSEAIEIQARQVADVVLKYLEP